MSQREMGKAVKLMADQTREKYLGLEIKYEKLAADYVKDMSSRTLRLSKLLGPSRRTYPLILL